MARIAGIDLPREKRIEIGLTYIYGIGRKSANDILAIGAALLGAKEVTAIDIDPMAVKVARENIEHNGLQDKVIALEGNLLDHLDVTCELCVANIIADVICFLCGPAKKHLLPGGTFICSGIIREREDDVQQALAAAGKRVPEDVRICGFDDSAESRLSKPALTTVHIHTQIIAFSAVHLLISRIKEPSLDFRTIHTETNLIYRDSTGTL